MKALVLRKTAFGESDLIVQFLLESGEVFSGFAAGGRKSKKRFPHQFDRAGLYDLQFSRALSKDKLTRIHSCDLLHYEPKLVNDVEVLCRWSMIMEWISLDEDQDFDFEEICILREKLSADSAPYHVFFSRQLKAHGLYPELERCVICEKPLSSRRVFHFQEGGLAHSSCGNGVFVGEASMNFLSKALQDDPNIDELSHSDSQELDQVILPFLEWQLGRSLKSRKVFLGVKPNSIQASCIEFDPLSKNA